MLERIKTWNTERKLIAHERFILQAGRRIIENRRREIQGEPPKGIVVRSEEGLRFAFSDTPLPNGDPSCILVTSAEFEGIDYGDVNEEELLAQVEHPEPRS